MHGRWPTTVHVRRHMLPMHRAPNFRNTPLVQALIPIMLYTRVVFFYSKDTHNSQISRQNIIKYNNFVCFSLMIQAFKETIGDTFFLFQK